MYQIGFGDWSTDRASRELPSAQGATFSDSAVADTASAMSGDDTV